MLTRKAPRSWWRILSGHLLTMAVLVLVGGFLASLMVRLAPGFGVDERELDTRLSQESQESLRQSRAAEDNIAVFYGRYLGGLLRGDLGVSRSLQRPVAALFAERVPITLKGVAAGLGLGWSLALALALPSAWTRDSRYDLGTLGLSGLFLCIPSALLAFLAVLLGWTASVAIALVVFPKVFRYLHNLFRQASFMPHLLLAHAKGLSRRRIFFFHVLPVAAPQILALAGVSVNLALGAAIPIEVICDVAGLGHLAWQGALGRDLPLLVNVTLLVTLLTLAANSVSDLVTLAVARRPA